MKKLFCVLVFAFLFIAGPVYAGRFGGGRSFGQHRSSQSYKKSGFGNQQHQQQKPQPHQSTPPATTKPSLMSRIFPALAGLSLGALFASLLGGHGLMGGLSSMLLIFAGLALVLFLLSFVKKLFASKAQTASRFHHFQQPATEPHTQTNPFGQTYQEQPQTYETSSYPQSNFDSDEFLRKAKTIFIRMQTAYDDKNLVDIRNFTTPEVFAEIQMQIQERGDKVNRTEVLHINASLVDEQDANEDFASVLFSGEVREERGAAPVYIKEVWNFIQKEGKWLIAGIEQ